MRFTSEKTNTINESYKRDKLMRMSDIRISSDGCIFLGSMGICNVTELTNVIESLDTMRVVIEEETGILF